uniref:proteasome endopeptidase complex n=2 Tax=Monopterus albus TaxID=43700 RepID=A0A3Q3IUR2_MONAL
MFNDIVPNPNMTYNRFKSLLLNTKNLTRPFLIHPSVQMENPPLVIAAASVLKELCYKNKEELQAGFITAGWDRKNGPQVYVVSLGGMLISQPVTIGGSGSTYIYGYVDAKYKPNMSREECLQFATNALALAMGRDNVSGGVAHLVVITEKGVEHVVVPGDKLPKFHDE